MGSAGENTDILNVSKSQGAGMNGHGLLLHSGAKHNNDDLVPCIYSIAGDMILSS
jgi:hypothetical protein